MSIPTPHIEAKKRDFAKTVIMPGDPKRAEWIANTFLTDVKLVNSVRGILGFTGKYKNKTVSVMASGMGNPSMGIYSYELFNFYNVDRIIRIGTCGTYEKNLELGDIILSQMAITDTNYCNMFKNNIKIVEANSTLLDRIMGVAKKLKIKYVVGKTFCTDSFYGNSEQESFMKENECIGVEMETAALYYNARIAGKEALTICSVSDKLCSHQVLTSLERQKALKDMVILAMEYVLNE